MKKILSLIVIGILVITLLGAGVSTCCTAGNNLQKSDDYKTLIISEFFPDSDEFRIVNDDNGQKIKMDSYNYIIEPGKPMLPSKNLLIALPLGAKIHSVDVIGINAEQIPGDYRITPSSYIIPLDDLEQKCIRIFKDEWQKNYEAVYSSDDSFPSQPGKLIGSGTLRKYSYVLISTYPFRYHPKSGRLFRYDSAQITINYVLSSSVDLEKMKWDTLADKKASELFVNYDQIKNLYEPQKIHPSSRKDAYNYVIITTHNLYDTLVSSDFISWKNMLGYNVRIVNVTDSEITGQSGIDLAEKIRNFLRKYYIDWGIEFVLIVGDYETVPMRYCYPDPSNHQNTAGTPGGSGGEVPTDYYYADLSSSDDDSWDFDGDGFHGEYIHDKPDFLPEVYVGRIPINDPSRILYTLDKTMAFEQDTSSWKNHALHPGAFFYFTDELGTGVSAMDGATCCAYIENDFMGNWTVSHYSEQEGLEKSIYPWNPLSEAAFTSDWRTGQYSIVNWGAHGWTDLIARKVWSWDDGDNIPEAHEISWPTLLSTSSSLDDDYPSIVTAISCYVGYPEPNNWGNIGIDLLTKPSYGASVGVISSARTPYGTSDWPTNPGASYSIIYEFNRFLINNTEKVGEAFFNSKAYCNINYDWYGWVEYNDLYTFNLFGDPSLIREGIDIGERPNKPSKPSGPTSGKIGEELTYSSSTTDPDNDQIYYMFYWGDGTNTSWIGPFESGKICNASHIWTEKGSFEIKIKAKDTNNLVSDFSDPLELTIPRNRIFYKSSFLKILDRLSTIFPILRYLLGK